MKYLATLLMVLTFGRTAFGQDIHKAFFSVQESGSKIEVKVKMNYEALKTTMETEKTCSGVQFKWCAITYVPMHMEFKMDGYPAELNFVNGEMEEEDYVQTFTTNDISGTPSSIDLKANCLQSTAENASGDYENVIDFDLFGVSKKYTLNSNKKEVVQKF